LVNGSFARVDTSGGAIAEVNFPNPNVSAGQSIRVMKVTTDTDTFTLKSPAGNINGTSGATGVACGGSGRQGFECTCDGTDWWVMPYAAF
jgi:hypothetical protein